MTETLESAYRRHADELIRYATAMVGPDDASGVVTDAMIGVFADDRGSDVADIDNIRAYLFRAVHHHVVDLSRSHTSRRRREEAYEGTSPSVEPPHRPSIDARRSLDHLSEQQRAVTFLTYWCDMTPPEIADSLDVGEGTVRKQLARARARLREVLDV